VIPPQIEGKTIEVNGEKTDAVEYFKKTMDMIAERYAKPNDALAGKARKATKTPATFSRIIICNY